MGGERHINFQWVTNGVFEMCERYAEQALRLVQDAENDSKEGVYQLVIGQIRSDINRIEDLLSESITKDVNEALGFPEPDRSKIDPEKLQWIMQLTEEFKGKILDIAREHTIEGRMNKAPFLLGAVMKCIVDLREKVILDSKI